MPTLLLVRTRQPQSNCQVPLKNAHLLRLQSFLLPPSDEETTPLMETEGITSASRFIVETMVQLDEYLSSESCSCEQIESNTTICESFSTTLEDCLALGEDIYEIKPFVFSNPVSNLNWRPIGLMKVGLIQQHKSNMPLRVLFDSGSDVTLIHPKALPKGANAKRTSVHLRTLAGSTKITREVTLKDISFPEFSLTRRLDKEVKAILSSNTGSYI